MPDPATVIKDQRRHLIQRLVTRSPLLRFLPGAYREDIFTLFEDITPNTPQARKEIGTEKNASTTPIGLLGSILSPEPKPATIFNPKKTAITKCRKIRQEADEYLHATGQDSLYIGYPLIFTPTEAGRFIFAPLFLWPISLAVKPDQITVDRLRNEDEKLPGEAFAPPAEARFNRIFKAWLWHNTGIELDWESGAEEVTFKNLPQQISQILKPWSQCEKQFSNSSLYSLPENPQSYFKAMAEKREGPRLLESAVIGLASFKGQALLDDLDHLEKKIQQDPYNCGLLKYFIFPRNTQIDDPAPIPPEANKWLITHSDHSQESAIWQTRKSSLMVLQGPPGTGKSQTIVNLIADALQAKKKVLVVCQKRAALDVVLKRMRAVGLGDLAELIDDPSKDRARVIKAIKTIEDNLAPNYPSTNRYQLCNDLLQSEEQLDTHTIALNETWNNTRPRYADLLAILHLAKTKEDVHIMRDFSRFYEKIYKYDAINTTEDLEELREEIRAFTRLYQQCSYENNSWRNITKKNIGYTDLDKINASLFKIIEIAKKLEQSKDRSFHSEELSWLAEHQWVSSYYLDFLPEPLRENQKQFQDLITHARYLGEWLPGDTIRTLLNEVRQSSKASAIYQELLDNLSWVQTICDVKTQIEQNRAIGLLHEYCRQKVSCWPEIIKAAKAQHWLDEIEGQYKIKTPREIEKIREVLRSLLIKKKESDKAHIQTRFQERLQPANDLGNMGLLRLRRVGANPHTSLRKLYTGGFEQVHRLRPVLLTNPETASSILELEPGLYDLAIIDEASQMFMADSLPILYRASSVVISGDGMQMPPADFFLSDVSDPDTDPDEDDEPVGADSGRLIAADGEYCLLDAAEHAAQVGSPNKKRLLVHYRSEFKELIDFSNYAFYEGKLIIPDGNLGKPSGLRSPIELHQVTGAFFSGENESEANKVIRRLKELWKDRNAPSSGIIAFNVKQRDKILELLFEEAQGDIKFAQRLDEERNRKTNDGEDISFFVRSVEHVQGDERDIIILSTTYDGTTRNFGPISKREKGRRRFNVAITRARLGMIIISSLNIDRISNEEQRDNSENYYFWKYMCYARAVDRGNAEEATQILKSLAVDSQPQPDNLDKLPDSLFEVEVAEFLRQKGFYVGYQIGESGFRIDLGVKRSAKEPRFLCGIECDGRQYHSSWKARLNDIWRQGILQEKGWKILRIWSTDWFSNQEHTKQKILNQLGEL